MWRGHSCLVSLSFRIWQRFGTFRALMFAAQSGSHRQAACRAPAKRRDESRRGTQECVRHEAAPEESMGCRGFRKLSGIGHSCLPCRDSSRHAFAVATKCRSQSVGMSARPTAYFSGNEQRFAAGQSRQRGPLFRHSFLPCSRSSRWARARYAASRGSAMRKASCTER